MQQPRQAGFHTGYRRLVSSHGDTLHMHDNDNLPPMTAARAESEAANDAYRSRIEKKDKAEAKAVARERKKHVKRQAIGNEWDGKAANDNVAWPLAKALLAERNNDLLRYALAYRKIEAQANSGFELLGRSQSPEDLMQLDQSTWIKPNGEIAYKGARTLTAAQFTGEAPAMQAVKADSTTRMKMQPVPKRWKGDMPLIEMLDAQSLLVRLRERLGPIVEPFEAAVCEGKTMEQVGREIGVGSAKQASGAAKALVILGLIAIRDALGEIRREDLAA